MDTIITTIGLDIAKSVFQVHGVDATGKAVVRRRLKRRQVVISSASSSNLASLVSKLVHLHIIGLAS
jgi:transposase